jgi:hypothetical protein
MLASPRGARRDALLSINVKITTTWLFRLKRHPVICKITKSSVLRSSFLSLRMALQTQERPKETFATGEMRQATRQGLGFCMTTDLCKAGGSHVNRIITKNEKILPSM